MEKIVLVLFLHTSQHLFQTSRIAHHINGSDIPVAIRSTCLTFLFVQKQAKFFNNDESTCHFPYFRRSHAAGPTQWIEIFFWRSV
jgi:hypothetical protein